ncbi:hypothetical protein L7F22_029157 [Adiantum nelumboides]|nr:hypothetical protein [Adiantum nelumboides]
MHFGKLDDSPMFRKQLQALEESAEALKDRCLKFYKGCRKYTEELGEAYDDDIAFASALESFGGGHDDPISVAVGGPVMTKFTIALREIGTYKEILRSQVEHMLSDRLIQFASIDLQDIKLESIRVPVQDLEELCEQSEDCMGRLLWLQDQSSWYLPFTLPLRPDWPHPPSVVMWSIRDAAAIFGTQEDPLRTWTHEMVSGICRGFSVPWEVRRRFDKASLHYDQAREKFLCLKKGTRVDVVSEVEEDLRNARSTFEQARFNLVTALSNIEAKKKFEFLESVSGTMDAHLRYFKQGYELLLQMEPYIHQVLTYAHQSRERATYEQAALAERMQEFRRQVEDNNQRSFSDVEASPSGDGIHTIGRSSHKMIEAVMQSTPRGKRFSSLGMLEEDNEEPLERTEDAMGRLVWIIASGSRITYQMGLSCILKNLTGNDLELIYVGFSRRQNLRVQVQTIKQGYLLKRSSSLRGDWKRRFFVLDSRGMLYYYRKHWGKPTGHSKGQGHSHGSDNTTGLLSRFLSSHQGSPQNDKTVAHHTVNLLTSTIKLDAEQTDLRFCFRIISPSKNYALQAENAMERMDWIDKITGVIASLLNSQASYSHRLPHSPLRSSHQRTGSESSSLSSSSEFDPTMSEDSGASRLLFSNGRDSGPSRSSFGNSAEQQERPIDVLRQVPGNDVCVDCNAPEPDWASLNLGVLLCIECSGVHRNLGVHISKVRSLTLDVKVWEPSVINVFQSLGNQFCNSVWEELFLNQDSPTRLSNVDSMTRFDSGHGSGELSFSLKKPDTRDSLLAKERFIFSKYAEKSYVSRTYLEADPASVACRIWDAVQAGNKQLVYRLLVCDDADVNTMYEHAIEGSRVMLPEPSSNKPTSHAIQVQENFNSPIDGTNFKASGTLQISRNGTSSGSSESASDDFELQGATLLYLACRNGDLGMIELLLQYGAQVNVVNGLGKTPLQQCIATGHSSCAKLLLSRGAHSELVDRGNRIPFQVALDHETGSEASCLSQRLF